MADVGSSSLSEKDGQKLKPGDDSALASTDEHKPHHRAPQHEADRERSRSGRSRSSTESRPRRTRYRTEVDEGEEKPLKPRSPKQDGKNNVLPISPSPSQNVLPTSSDLTSPLSPTGTNVLDEGSSPLASPSASSSYRSPKSSRSGRSNISKSPNTPSDSINRRSSTSNRRHSSRDISSSGSSKPSPRISKHRSSQALSTSTSPKGRMSASGGGSSKMRSPRTPGSSPHSRSRRRTGAQSREQIRSPRLMEDESESSTIVGSPLIGESSTERKRIIDIKEDNPRGHADEKLSIVAGLETLSVESDGSFDTSSEESEDEGSDLVSPVGNSDHGSKADSYDEMPRLEANKRTDSRGTPSASRERRKKHRPSSRKRSSHSPRKERSPRGNERSSSSRKSVGRSVPPPPEDDREELDGEHNGPHADSHKTENARSPKRKSSRQKNRSHAQAAESPRRRQHARSSGTEHERDHENESVKSSSDRSERSDKSGRRNSRRSSNSSVPTVRRRGSVDKVADYTSPTSPKTKSWIGAVRQEEAMNALRNRARRGENKPLGVHMHSDKLHGGESDDDKTLGASTISTNFTAASVRSLFQSHKGSTSQALQPPPRRTSEFSEHDEDDEDDGDMSFRLEEKIVLDGDKADSSLRSSGHASGTASIADSRCSQISQEINDNFEFLSNASDHGSSLHTSSERTSLVRKPSGDDLLEMTSALENTDITKSGSPRRSFERKAPARKPSGDDVPVMSRSTSADATTHDSSSNDSDFMKWQKENAQNIVGDVENDGSARDSVTFLQIKPESSAVTANVTPAADLDSPLQIKKEGAISSHDEAIKERAAVQFDSTTDGDEKEGGEAETSEAIQGRNEFRQFNGGVIPNQVRSPNSKSPGAAAAAAAKLFRKPKIKLFGRKNLKGAVALEDEGSESFGGEEYDGL